MDAFLIGSFEKLQETRLNTKLSLTSPDKYCIMFQMTFLMPSTACTLCLCLCRLGAMCKQFTCSHSLTLDNICCNLYWLWYRSLRNESRYLCWLGWQGWHQLHWVSIATVYLLIGCFYRNFPSIQRWFRFHEKLTSNELDCNCRMHIARWFISNNKAPSCVSQQSWDFRID